MAVGGALTAVDAVLGSTTAPLPWSAAGHHAMPIAAWDFASSITLPSREHAQSQGLEKVLIVDWTCITATAPMTYSIPIQAYSISLPTSIPLSGTEEWMK